MIKVYFESGSHAECVATFMDEATYMACLPTLEQIATTQGMHVTESEIDSAKLSSHLLDAIDEIQLSLDAVDDGQAKQEYTEQIESLNEIMSIITC